MAIGEIQISKTPAKFSAKNFMAWVRTKPATQWYDYRTDQNCPFAQFLKSLGYSQVMVGPVLFAAGEEGTYRLPKGVDDALRVRPHTYGALLERLENGRSTIEKLKDYINNFRLA